MTSRRRLALLLTLAVPVVLLAVSAAWSAWVVHRELGGEPWIHPNVIVDRNGTTILEMYGDGWRPATPVRLADLPDHVPHAFLAAEDVRFYRHPGIDPIGIGRAALSNVRSKGIAEGGSTITQQLAKTKFLTADRTFRRKFREVILAFMIEARLSKDQILEAYLNDVYLGHADGRAVLGIDEAARLYFDTDAEDLTPAQAALLAGMVRAPNRDNASDAPDVAKSRRDAVLDVMNRRGWLSNEALDEARGEDIRFRRGDRPSVDHGFLLAALRREIIDAIGERTLRGGGLTIHTTTDLDMQSAAERAVARGTRDLRRRHSWIRRAGQPLEAAILAIDPESGGIRALVGGADFGRSQFDRTRSMRRQPGSAIKPFVYATAIERKEITAASIIEDRPVEIELSRNDVWSPNNYDERFRGDVTVRESLEKSLNVPAVRVAERTGLRTIRRTLDHAGIEADLSKSAVVALGVDEVSMRELAGAYTVFPNLGRRSIPHLVEKVVRGEKRTIWEFRKRGRDVLDPATAYIVHSMLRGVVERGTASALRRYGLRHAAGKTGTTSDYRDAWFAGYVPDLVTVTWVGFDDGTPLRLSSAEAALPVWARFVSAVDHSRDEIPLPETVAKADIDLGSGLLWREGCGRRFTEFFRSGTEPRETCSPSRRRPISTARFEEPPVISASKLREWLASAPGVISSVEVVEVPVEEGPPGASPGDIIIETEEREPPEDDEKEEELRENRRDAETELRRDERDRRADRIDQLLGRDERREQKRDEKDRKKLEKEREKEERKRPDRR